ncbi:MAG: PAS domain S-box protein, partial [Blastocatellia bacterium]
MDERQRAVLIAAGAPEDRAALREMLLSDPAARYSVIEGGTGVCALKLCRARAPDCLILDRDLPDLSVVEALEQLTAEDGSLACAVVVLVGAGGAQMAVEAMKSGAHDCLEKDRVQGEELRRAVSQAIEKADRQRQVAAREREMAGQKRAEEELRLLKTAIEQSAESVTIMTAQLDPPGPQIVYVNPAFTKITGYTLEDVIGKTPRILQGPKTDRAVLDRLRKDCEGSRVFFGEMVSYRKDGSECYVEWSIVPVCNERGEATHFIATQRDVTKRRRVEEELRRSEEEFRSLFDLSAIGMTQVSPSGKYLRVNRKLCKMLGYT